MWSCPELVGAEPELELSLNCKTEVYGVGLPCISWVCGGTGMCPSREGNVSEGADTLFDVCDVCDTCGDMSHERPQ